MYARDFFMVDSSYASRSLSDPLSGPSLIVNFEPRYLLTMRDLLGTPSIIWREVAP